MTKIKKLVLLCTALTLTLSLGAFAACKNKDKDKDSSSISEVESSSVVDSDSDTASDSTEEEFVPVQLNLKANTLSVGAGETVHFSFHGEMTKDYVLSWTSENAVVAINGSIITKKSYTFTFNRTTMDFTVTTANGAAEDIVITVERVLPPALSLSEENKVSITKASENVERIFIAEETATYTITSTHDKGIISVSSESSISENGATLEIQLAKGQMATLSLSAKDSFVGDITLKIEKTGEYNPYLLHVNTDENQTNSLYFSEEKLENVAFTLTVPETGYYAFSMSDASVTLDGTALTYGETKKFNAGDVLTLVCTYTGNINTISNGAKLSIVKKYRAELGDNAFALIQTEEQKYHLTVEFVATEEGSYTFNTSDSVTLWVWDKNESLKKIEIAGTSISLKAGEIYLFYISSESLTEVTVTVAKA